MWLWGTTIDKEVSDATQGQMLKKYTESEAQKAAKPAASPWVTIGNVEAEVPLSAAGLPVTGAGAKTEGIAGFDYDVLTQKPFRRNDVEDKEIEDALNEERPMWSNRLEFILASMAAIWGISNMWSFIQALQDNGKGVFLIPYFLLFMLFSLPTLIMEMLIGQVFRRGVILTMSKIHKFFEGIGKSILFVTILYNIYFNTTTAWTLYYVIKGVWQAIAPNSSYPGHGECSEKGWTGDELTCCEQSTTLFHWYYEFLHISKSPLSLGDLGWYTTYDKFWPLAVIVMTWALIAVFMSSGLWVKGKIPYISLVIPLLVFLLLFSKALATWKLTVKNVDEPVAKLLDYFTPEWNKLWLLKTWMVAATQAFRVSLCGLGVFGTYSSYANPQYNLLKDGILIATWGMLAPLITTLLLIPVASYYTVSKSVQKLSKLPTDFSLVFVIIPTVIQDLELSISNSPPDAKYCTQGNILVAIYFFTLFTLTMVTALAIGEVVLTTLNDIPFPNKIIPFELPNKRVTLSVSYSIVSCIVGLLFGLQNGAYLFELVDQVIYPIPSMFIACAEMFALTWIYSIYRFNDDLWLKCGYQIPVGWQQYFTWVLSPGLFLTFLSELYLQFGKSVTDAESKVNDISTINYGYPMLTSCKISADFRTLTPWPTFLLFMQWALIIFCALWPVWSSLSYNAQTRDKWRIYKHKRKYPLGIIYPTDNRGEWAMPQAYVIAQSGAAIGVGIITRFAFKYYAFGKYVFVLMCFIVHFLVTLPAFILEIDLGQVFRSGPISVWKKVHPIFSGIGWCCLFINWFQAVNYMYPTITIADYLVQWATTQLALPGIPNNYAPTNVSEELWMKYASSEKANRYPWNNCLMQAFNREISTNDNVTLANFTITNFNATALITQKCLWAPAVYQFVESKIDYTDSIEHTDLWSTFVVNSADLKNASDVFLAVKRLFITEADLMNRYMCVALFGFIGLITAIKPSLRHLLFGFQYVLPFFGIILGCIYVGIRGGLSPKLLEMLFELTDDEGKVIGLWECIVLRFSNPTTWTDAGVVTMSFHAIGTGVNIAFSSYNPRDNWVNLQGMVITCYAWFGNIIFMVFYFMNVVYMEHISNATAESVTSNGPAFGERRIFYGLQNRTTYKISDVMNREMGGSYLFMATLAESLSYHKHTMAVLPLMLLCTLMNCIGSVQAIVETMATSLVGLGFFPFSRLPSCMMAAFLCIVLSQVYALKTGFGFFMYQIFENYVYGWPVPVLSAIMVIAGTWVYSMYRLNNAMFMYSMHHLHYYWMFVWPFIVPLGQLSMAAYRAYLTYSQLLGTHIENDVPTNYSKAPYLSAWPKDEYVNISWIENGTRDDAQYGLMNIYLKSSYWPKEMIYVSSAIYILYMAPFILIFVLVGTINCIKDFSCKPVCFNYYEEPEEVEVEEGFNFDNIIQTPRQALEFKRKQGDDISFHEGSIIYSDIDSALTPSETEASVYTTSDESEASSILDPDDPFSVKRKALRKIERRKEAEEEAKREAARTLAIRNERIAMGLRGTPTPEPSIVSDEGALEDGLEVGLEYGAYQGDTAV